MNHVGEKWGLPWTALGNQIGEAYEGWQANNQTQEQTDRNTIALAVLAVAVLFMFFRK